MIRHCLFPFSSSSSSRTYAITRCLIIRTRYDAVGRNFTVDLKRGWTETSASFRCAFSPSLGNHSFRPSQQPGYADKIWTRDDRIGLRFFIPFPSKTSSLFHELFRSRPRSGKVFSFEQINPKWDNLSPPLPQPLSFAQPLEREFFNNNATNKLVTRRRNSYDSDFHFITAPLPFLSSSNKFFHEKACHGQ